MEEEGKTCCFFGHTYFKMSQKLIEKTNAEIKKALADGVRTFLFGGLSDFEDICYVSVTSAKIVWPHLNIQRVFCVPLEKELKKSERWLQNRQFEEVICPPKSFDYWFTSIYYRNCAMIDMSDLVIFCVEPRKNSGAYKTYLYAKRMHKDIINLLPEK